VAVDSSGIDLSADAGTRPGPFHLPMKKQLTAKSSLPILTVRGERVVIDFALARIYGVTTGRFNEAVKRNLKRFPADFSFVVTRQEYEELISQNAISKPGRGGRTKLPRVFTEHGALMAASILNSERAIAMSVYVIRAFVEIRERLATNAVILKRLAEIDKTLVLHGTALSDIYQKLLPLLSPPPDPPRRQIGFTR
jgi:ORF6N domain